MWLHSQASQVSFLVPVTTGSRQDRLGSNIDMFVHNFV